MPKETDINELGSLVKEFKEVNDQILAKQKASEGGVAEIKTKQDRIETRLDTVEAKLQKEYLDGKKAQEMSQKYGQFKYLPKNFVEHCKEMVNDKFTKGFSDYLRKGNELFLDPEYKEMKKINDSIAKTMTVADDSTGGIFAPPEVLDMVIRDLLEISAWRSLVTVRPTAFKSVSINRQKQRTQVKRVAEAGSMNETKNPLFDKIEIPAHKAYARTDITMEDLTDPAFDLESFLYMDWAEQFDYQEGFEITKGTGLNECKGMTNETAITQGVTAASSSAFTADNVIDLFAAPKSGYEKNFTFVANRKTKAFIRKLKDSSNRYLWDMGFNSSPSGFSLRAPMTVLGAPYQEIPDMDDIGSSKVVAMVGDFKKAYMLVDRMGINVLRDIYTSADQDIVRIFARKRFGGQTVLPEAVAKLTMGA